MDNTATQHGTHWRLEYGINIEHKIYASLG